MLDLTPYIEEYKRQTGELADNLTPIPLAQVQNMINSGVLAGALGYSSPGDIQGMTPETFAASMRTYRNPIEVMQNTAQTADLLTGRSKKAQLMSNILDKVFNTQTSAAVHNDAQQFQGEQGNLNREQTVLDRNQRATQFDISTELHKEDMKQRAKEHEESRQLQLKIHNDNAGFQRERLNLEKRRLKYIQDSLQTQSIDPNNFVMPNDPKLHKMYSEELKYYTDNKGKVKDGQERNWAITFMKRQSLGTKVGTVINTNDFASDLDNYKQLILGHDGWYGIVGKGQRTNNPVIPLHLGTMNSSTNKTYHGVPTYDLSSED